MLKQLKKELEYPGRLALILIVLTACIIDAAVVTDSFAEMTSFIVGQMVGTVIIKNFLWLALYSRNYDFTRFLKYAAVAIIAMLQLVTEFCLLGVGLALAAPLGNAILQGIFVICLMAIEPLLMVFAALTLHRSEAERTA